MMSTRFPRIRRDLSRMGLGVVQLATKARTRREHESRVGLFNDLVENAQIGVLRELLAGEIAWEALRELKRQGRLLGADVLGELALSSPWTEAVTRTLPRMGKSEATRKRYALSLRHLRERYPEFVPATLPVRELGAVPWTTVRERWLAAHSTADWNHLVRAMSAWLTKLVGKAHPFRHQVLALLEKAGEPGRVPDLTPAEFWRIVAHVPPHIQPALVTLVLTGMRVRTEYLRCDRTHLMPHTYQVRVPGTKTDGSAATVSVAPDFWTWVDAAIPAPIQYKALRGAWVKACLATGHGQRVPDPRHMDADGNPELRYQGLRLHDLRHAMGQWATDAGVDLTQVQDQLRHASLQMAGRYARRANTRRVAGAVGASLGAQPGSPGAHPVTLLSPKRGA